METKRIDYTKALHVVEKVNSLVEETPGLTSWFVEGGVNYWQSYQSTLFSDAKQWSKGESSSSASLALISRIKMVVVGLLLETISLVSLLMCILIRPKLLIFTGDSVKGVRGNDPRLDDLYRALKQEDVSFVEMVHVVPGKKTLSNFLQRGRKVLYLEAIDFVYSPFVAGDKRVISEILSEINWQGWDPEERMFAQDTLTKLMRMKVLSQFRCKVVFHVLRIIRVETVVSIDDPRHYNELMHTAKKLGIPSYAIQHGHFTKYHTGWIKMTDLRGDIPRPDKIIVWSEYWKKELLRLGTYFTPEDIVVGGSKGSAELIQRKQGKGVVLIPYETDAPKAEVVEYIEEFVKLGWKVAIKTRPDIPRETQLREYGLSENENILVVESVYDLDGKVSFVAGVYSTFLYEMVEALVPVAILETSMDYGKGMVENGLAESLSIPQTAGGELERIANLPQEALEDRRERLLEGADVGLQQTIRSIIAHNVSDQRVA